MVGRPPAAARRLEDQPQLVAHAHLPDDLVERLRAQGSLDRPRVAGVGGDGLDVGALLRAALRTLSKA